jgi:hypothetical protein
MQSTSTPNLDASTMTQAQADVAADCEEVLFNQSQPELRGAKRELEQFNQYCGAFGFRTPIGPQNKAFNDGHAAELLRKLRQHFDNVPSTTRQYSGRSRFPPLFFGAEHAMRQRPATRAAKISVEAVPAMQHGLWSTHTHAGGKSTDAQVCGDPLERIKREILQTRGYLRFGCTVDSSAPHPGSVSYVFDCPADRSEGGMTVRKGRTEITIAASSPQAFSLTVRRIDGSVWRAEGTRTGDCK